MNKKIFLGVILITCIVGIHSTFATKTYSLKEDFIKAEGKTCKTATDGVNTFWGENFSLSTRIGYPEDFVAKWKCIDNEEETKICTMEYAPVCGIDRKTYSNSCTAGNVKIDYEGECKKENGLVESLNNEFENLKKELGKKAQKIEKNVEKYKTKLQKFSEQKQIKLNEKIIKKIQKMEDKLFEGQPLGGKLPEKITNKFNLLRYLELKLQIIQNSFSKNINTLGVANPASVFC